MARQRRLGPQRHVAAGGFAAQLAQRQVLRAGVQDGARVTTGPGAVAVHEANRWCSYTVGVPRHALYACVRAQYQVLGAEC